MACSGISPYAAPEVCRQEQIKPLEAKSREVIENAGAKILRCDFYVHFAINDPVIAKAHAVTREEAACEWKFLLNPKRKHLLTVLDRTIRALKEAGISIIGKTPRYDCPRNSAQSILDDPCEPKIMVYLYGTTEQEGKEMAVKVMPIIEHAFTPSELISFACPQGLRPRLDGTVVPQWGPSFTKMRSPLIFYQQGGYLESGRDTVINDIVRRLQCGMLSREEVNATLAEEMGKLFTGDNFSLHAGTIDPFAEQGR